MRKGFKIGIMAIVIEGVMLGVYQLAEETDLFGSIWQELSSWAQVNMYACIYIGGFAVVGTFAKIAAEKTADMIEDFMKRRQLSKKGA